MIVYAVFATDMDYYGKPELYELYYDQVMAEEIASNMRKEKDEYDEDVLYSLVTVERWNIK
jgi:hypothetical protein